MAASTVVVFYSSLTKSYGIMSFVVVPIGVSGIDSVLGSVDCFNGSLKFSGLVGCVVCLLFSGGCYMLFKDVLVLYFIKCCFF